MDMLRYNSIVKDTNKSNWIIKDLYSTRGGFGILYNVESPYSNKKDYVIKFEPIDNQTLYTEMKFCIKMSQNKDVLERKQIGLAYEYAFGSFVEDSKRYGFITMPKYHYCITLIVFMKKRNKNFIEEYINEYIHNESSPYTKEDVKTYLNIKCQGLMNYIMGSRGKFALIKEDIIASYWQYCREIISIFEFMHNLGYCYNDLKNEHLMLKNNKIVLIDFGLVRKINNKKRSKFTLGTLLYTSLNSYEKINNRKSDLESMCYTIAEWFIDLPWSKLCNNNYINTKFYKESEQIRRLKHNFLNNASKNAHIPLKIKKFINYVNKLENEQIPDYNFCKSIFI